MLLCFVVVLVLLMDFFAVGGLQIIFILFLLSACFFSCPQLFIFFEKQ